MKMKMNKVHSNILCSLVLIFYSYQSYAVDVNPLKASKLNSYEFGELVKNYMPNINTPTNWNYNTNNQNIVWDTGIEWNSYTQRYEKEGYIRINFDKYKLSESEYKNNKRVRSEAAWTVTYYGVNNKNVNQVSFDHSKIAGMLSSSESERAQPFNSLIRQGITYKPVCLYKIDSGNYSIGYELSAANKKDTYLTQGASAGSGGLSVSYDLFYDKEDMFKSFEVYGLDTSNSNCL